jgi:hypothetical protein
LAIVFRSTIPQFLPQASGADVHYGDGLTPRNIPPGVYSFLPGVKRFGNLASMQKLPSRKRERDSAFNGKDYRQRRELLRRKVRSRRRLDWDLFY